MERVCNRTTEERVRLVAEQHMSGKTRKAWCEERGINIRTFSNWVRKSRDGTDDTSTVDWVELNSDSASPESDCVRASDIEISAGPYTIRVKPGFDSRMLSDICRTLCELC
jgi:hypothetical protein